MEHARAQMELRKAKIGSDQHLPFSWPKVPLLARMPHHSDTLQMSAILSPLITMRPMVRLVPRLRQISYDSSRTTFMNSSKPIILPSMRKSVFSWSHTSTRAFVWKNLKIRNYGQDKFKVRGALRSEHKFVWVTYNRPDHESLQLAWLVLLHVFPLWLVWLTHVRTRFNSSENYKALTLLFIQLIWLLFITTIP